MPMPSCRHRSFYKLHQYYNNIHDITTKVIQYKKPLKIIEKVICGSKRKSLTSRVMLVYICAGVIFIVVLAVRNLFKKLWLFKTPSKQDYLFHHDLLTNCHGNVEIEQDQSKREKVLKNVFSIDKVPKSLDAIVVGSGIGALTSAGLLSKAGKKVLVLEQHDQAGGCCHVFAEKGFEFDIGIHYVGNVEEGSMARILIDQLTNGKLQWVPLDNVYDILAMGRNYEHRYHYEVGREKQKQYLIDKFPGEEKAIHKFFQCMREAAWCANVIIMLKLLPKPLVKCLLTLRVMHWFFPCLKYLKRTVCEVLDEITDNVHLRSAFIYSYGNYGTSPDKGSFAMHSIMVIHTMLGTFYPKGGASEIAYNMIPIIEASGGRVLVRVKVKEIIVSNGCAVGVKVTKGKQEYTLMAPLIISDAGLMNTVHKLLPDHVTKKYQMDRLTKIVKPSAGVMSVFVGLDGTKEELGLTAQNTWAFTDEDIENAGLNYLMLTPEDAKSATIPLVFISFPSAKDPTFNSRYPGKSTGELITVTPSKWFEEWKDEKVMHRGDDYTSFKMKLGRQIWQQTCVIYPHLEDKLEYFEVGTPLSNRYYLESFNGEVYGLDHDVNRFDPYVQTELRPETPVSGLYLTGQDVFCVGFGGGLMGGMLCASAILKRNIPGELMKMRSKWKKMNKSQ